LGLLDRLRERDLVPSADRAALAAEDVVVDERNVSLSVRFERYRAPGRYHGLRRTRFRGAVIVTRARLVVFMGPDRLLDASFAAPAAHELTLDATPEGLTIGFDAALFDPQRSGRVDVVARVADPPQVLAHVRGRLRS
jgi:hypothetical protein